MISTVLPTLYGGRKIFACINHLTQGRKVERSVVRLMGIAVGGVCGGLLGLALLGIPGAIAGTALGASAGALTTKYSTKWISFRRYQNDPEMLNPTNTEKWNPRSDVVSKLAPSTYASVRDQLGKIHQAKRAETKHMLWYQRLGYQMKKDWLFWTSAFKANCTRNEGIRQLVEEGQTLDPLSLNQLTQSGSP